MDDLVQLLNKPGNSEGHHNEQELAISRLWLSAERVIKTSYQGVCDLWQRHWHGVLYWILSTSINEDSPKPFRTNYWGDTVKRYSGYWAAFLCFCVRIHNQDEKFGVHFNEEQDIYLDRLWIILQEEGEDIEESVLDDLVLEISMAFIRQQVHSKYRSSLLYILAVFGWDIEMKVWKKAEDYTTILAGIQFCIRVLVTEYALPSNDREFMEEDPIQIFRNTRDQWLVEGTSFPFSEIHKLLNFGWACARNASTRPKVRWSPDGKVLYWENNVLEMAAFKQFVVSMVEEAERMLSKNLLFRLDFAFEETDLYSIRDDPTKPNKDYFWLEDVENGFKSGGQRVLRALRKSDAWTSMVRIVNGRITFTQDGIDKYKTQDLKYLEQMAAVLVLTCGITGRGQEMLSVLYKNTQTEERNMSVEHGQFMQVTQYHKSFAITDQFKVCSTAH